MPEYTNGISIALDLEIPLRLKADSKSMLVLHCLRQKVALLPLMADFKTSEPFWSMLQLLPIHSDEIMCFKSLIIIHKSVNGGSPVVNCIVDAKIVPH